MRCVFLLPLLVFPLLTGCDYLLAEPISKRWISYGAVGLEVTKTADRYGGRLYWLSKDGERFRDPFSGGLFDDQNNMLLFPLALRRGGSVQELREGDSKYVEIEMDFDSDELVGKWRTGTNPPDLIRTFTPYEGD